MAQAATGREVTVDVVLRRPHAEQARFIESTAKRKVIRAGRRGGKTVGVATLAVKRFLAGRRQLYQTPTAEQMEAFWYEVKRALFPAIDAGIYHKNETEHVIEVPNTKQRIRAKTAWNADTARGDWGDDLYFDEWQLCDETAWTEVGAPMLLDTDGTATFVYTPPSLRSSGISRARDPLHAAKMYKMAEADKTGRWEVFHFTSHQNPHLVQAALDEMTLDMSRESYRREILAEDDDESPNRLIYRAFNEATNLIPPFELPAAWPRYVGHDFGGANPAALWFAQDPATGYLYAYQEYFPGRGLSTYEHVQAFKALAAGLTVLKRAGGSHQEDEIRQGYTSQGWPIQEPKVRDVNAGIDRVRAMMEKNQVFVFRTLHRFTEELRTYVWEVDKDGAITDNIRNKAAFHLSDACRYILSDFTPERVVDRRRSARVRVGTWS